VPLVAAVAAYLVLAVDWMGELRFLTPAWPLLSVAAVLGGAQLLALAETGRIRVAIAVVLLSCVVIAAPEWGHRTQSFRASPTAPLCVVATGYGQRLEATARALARDDQSLSVAVPDIGGVLLATDVHVVDIGGLVNRRIARLLKEGDSAGIARYVLDEVRPTVILDHAPWTRMSGLTASRLRPDYVDVDHGREWVRREALERLPDPDATLARITERAARFDGPFPETCGRALFG